MPTKTHDTKPLTPEQRRRMGVKPKAVFTTSMAADEVRNKFRLKVSFLFNLMVAMGIFTMWLVAYTKTSVSKDAQWFFMGACIVFFATTWLLRKSSALSQAMPMVLGLCTAGAVVGMNAPQGSSMFSFLINPTLLIGVPLVGLMINLLFTKKDRSQFVHFLSILPWVVTATAIVWFYPAGEMVMALSGTVSLFFIILLLLGGTQAQPLYRVDEVTKAAADVLPLAFSSFSNEE